MAKKVLGGICVAIMVLLLLCLTLGGWAAVIMKSMGYSVVSEGKYDKTIVYIGDSIAEALIGPSPLGERDNYGYYAVLGKVNNYRYFNHSVSGYKTSGSMTGGSGLVELLNRDDENATLMKTHLEEADIIDISILGNNILQYNLGLLLLEVADPDFDDKYAAGETLINAMENGETVTRDSVEEPGQVVTFAFPETYKNLGEIIDRLRSLNEDATILFQTVYNPFYEGSTHLHQPVMDKLAEITDVDGQFGESGATITTVKQYRAVAQKLLDLLNSNLYRYLDEHPGAFEIIDVNKRFDEITKLDVNEDGEVDLSGDCLGRYLIFDDWTHPSNFGHAVIADVTQEKLVELGFADEEIAIANYKQLRLEQLERLYQGVKGFDYNGARNAVINAATFDEVTLRYFQLIRGYLPKY